MAKITSLVTPTKITAMDKPAVRALGDRALELLQVLEQEFGVSVTPKGGSYDSKSAVVKFEIAVVGDGGQAETREMQALRAMAEANGITPEQLAKPVTLNGKLHKLVGYKARARRRPWVTERVSDGKAWVWETAQIRQAFGLSAGPKFVEDRWSGPKFS